VPAPKAPPIELSPDQERGLKRLVAAHSTPQKLAERARIILLAATGQGISESAAALSVWRKTVRLWRRHWEAAAASAGSAARLSDAPRCGAPAIFAPEQICQLMAIENTFKNPVVLPGEVLSPHTRRSSKRLVFEYSQPPPLARPNLIGSQCGHEPPLASTTR